MKSISKSFTKIILGFELTHEKGINSNLHQWLKEPQELSRRDVFVVEPKDISKATAMLT